MSATRQPIHDDRFVTPLETSRRGAHRARGSAALAVLPYAAIVVVIVIALIFAVKLIQGNTGGSSSADQTSGAGATTKAGGKTSSGSSTAKTSGGASDGTPVDHAVVVTLLNSTTTSGLAGRAAKVLNGAGWKKAAASFTKTDPQNTTVYYATKAQRSTAQAIAEALGKSTITRNPTLAGTGITVVIGADYTP